MVVVTGYFIYLLFLFFYKLASVILHFFFKTESENKNIVRNKGSKRDMRDFLGTSEL